MEARNSKLRITESQGRRVLSQYSGSEQGTSLSLLLHGAHELPSSKACSEVRNSEHLGVITGRLKREDRFAKSQL